MYIIDGHLDLAWNALQWNRDLCKSVYTIRTQERNPGISIPGKALGTVSLQEMRKGNVALCFATLLVRSTGIIAPHIDYPSIQQAYGIARGQLAYYKALNDTGEIRIIYTARELDTHIQEWEIWEREKDIDDAVHQPPLGIVISMESADSIIEPTDLRLWWNEGVRIIGPAHYGPGRYVGGTGTESGFNERGLLLLEEMEKQGLVLDLSHLSDKAFWEAMENYSGNILASHNNCRSIVPNQRQFDDKQIRAIVNHDGVIGAVLDASMLQLGWRVNETNNSMVTLSNVVDHIDHICQLAGSSQYVAIGSDLDGGFGLEQSPNDLDTIFDLQKFQGILQKRGYTNQDIEAIFHGNWLRILRRSLT